MYGFDLNNLPSFVRLPLSEVSHWLMISLVISLLSRPYAIAMETEAIFYPKAEAIRDQRTLFPVKLLEQILNQTPSASRVELLPTQSVVSQEKALKLLDLKRIHVVWSGRSEERNRQYRAIEIPIQKGYLGWRIMLVNSKHNSLLENISSAEQLKRFSLLSGHDWPEVQLYQALGFDVVTEESYQDLFTSLAKGNADLFPRSVMEIWQEAQTYQHLGISVEPSILVKYPYALYYYVAKSNQVLADRIHVGFSKIIETGQYEELFQQTFGEQLKYLNLSNRKVINLPEG